MNQYSSLTSEDREKMFWGNVDIRGLEECWEWKASRFPNGYGQTKLGFSKKGNTAHRVAMEYTHGYIPKELYILHSCDNKPCCNPNHLRIGTHQENMEDSRVRGQHRSGERHRWYGVPKTKEEKAAVSRAQLGRRKHSSDVIEAIRADLGTESLRMLAIKHGVAYSYVQRIGAGTL